MPAHTLRAGLLITLLFAAVNGQDDRRLRWQTLDPEKLISNPARQSLPAIDATLQDKLRDAKTRALPGPLRVMIYLKEQPFPTVHAEASRRHAFRLETAQQLLRNAQTRAGEPGLADALQTADQALIDFRKDLFRELERAQRESQDQLTEVLRSHGAVDLRRLTALNLLTASLPVEAIEALARHPAIGELGLDQELEHHLSVSSPAIFAPFLWNAGFTGAGQTVLVIDSGVSPSHPAFQGRVRSETFAETNTACPPSERSSALDFNGHGTHVAGIIASAGTSAFPTRLGVAHGVSSILSAKVSCENGRSFGSDILRAVESALAASATAVVNNSNGGSTTQDDDFQSRRIDELIDRFNLTWANSAGNSGPGARTISTPGTAYNLISVASINPRGTVDRSQAVISEFSSRGPTIGGRFKPDVAAPGENIFSTRFDSDGYVALSGTSMASPHIAGAAVLLRQAGVTDRLILKALLINTTDSAGWDPALGWGYVNLRRALEQSKFVVTGNLNPERGAAAFYTGSLPANRNLFATLAWNRFVRDSAQFLRDLDLAAFRRTDQQLLARSASTQQNVEQVGIRGGAADTPIVLTVAGMNDGSGVTEPFVIALSEAGFQAARGPVLNVSCSAPGTFMINSVARLNCRIGNDGDLPVFTGTARAFFEGMPQGSAVPFNTIAPGASLTVPLDVQTPTAPGDATLIVNLSGTSFESTIPVSGSLRVNVQGTPMGTPVINAVVHGASFGTFFAPGGWVSILGSNLAPATRTWRTADFNGSLLPTALDGTRVTMNGRPAFVAFVSPAQLNVLAPDDTGSGPVSVQVTTTAGASNTFTAQRAPIVPALFVLDAGGRKFPAAVHADGSLVAPQGLFSGVAHGPARPNEVLSFFGTGCGATNPPTPAERVVSGSPRLANATTAAIGSAAAEVLFAGLTGSGLCQFNVRVPAAAVDGESNFTITVGNVTGPILSLPILR